MHLKEGLSAFLTLKRHWYRIFLVLFLLFSIILRLPPLACNFLDSSVRLRVRLRGGGGGGGGGGGVSLSFSTGAGATFFLFLVAKYAAVPNPATAAAPSPHFARSDIP